MTRTIELSRRNVLQTGAAAGAGLVLAFKLPLGDGAAYAAEAAPEVTAWLRIAPDDTITVQVAHCEMGQGVLTGLPMLVAEELAADWTKIRAELAPADPVYGDPGTGRIWTGGSRSTRTSFVPLRQVGAQAREMLRMAAAQRWKVPLGECTASKGEIVHAKTDRKLSYGKLASAAGKLTPPKDVALKDDKDWTIIGKPTKRLDTPLKVDGSAKYGIDTRLDGMLVGSVMASPVFGGKLKSVDEKPAMAIPGVHSVVKLDDAIIVLASGYWPAHRGLLALRPEWDAGANAQVSTGSMLKDYTASLDMPGATAHDNGDASAALKGAAKTIEAVYRVPYLAHATMEPMNCTVRANPDGTAEVWAPTQSPTGAQMAAAQVLGLKPEKVQVHSTFLGGGFGRRGEDDYVVFAAQAAKASGRPVKVVWSREEDMRHDFYRPAALVRFRAGLDASGMPSVFEAKLVLQSIMSRVMPFAIRNGVDSLAVEGIADTNYTFPNARVEYVLKDGKGTTGGAPVGFWRSVGHSHNGFFIESFIDEVAHAGGKDPVALRRVLLANAPRHKAVLEKAASAAGWGTPLAPGRYRGVAIMEAYDTIVAQVAEISIDRGTDLRVHKVTAAVDCGWQINPVQLEAQVESAVVYGLTAALYGEITLTGGRVDQANFNTYQMLKLAQMPAVEVHVIESRTKIGGMGEPGTPPIAPAVTNAIFAATGKRIRALPLNTQGVLGA